MSLKLLFSRPIGRTTPFKFIFLFLILTLLWLINNFSLNVPTWDQWGLVDLYEKVDAGSADLGDFFALHNEHRLIFPKLIFVTLAFLSHWNINYELYFSVLLAVITFATICYIASFCGEGANDQSKYLSNIITCMLIFSIVQHENWLWGFQLAWFLINTCLLTTVLIIRLANRNTQKLYFAAIPCIIASFSSAHGLLTWLAVIPSVIAIDSNFKQRKTRVILWILLFAVTCAVYFIGYHKPESHPSLLSFLQKPFVAGKYFFTILGTPIFRQELISPIIGIIIFSLFLFAIIRSLYQDQHKFNLSPQTAAWISIGLFSLLFALMTTVGRSGFGVEQAMASRYTTSAVLITVATVQLYRLSFWKSSFLTGIMIGLFLVNSGRAVAQAETNYIQRKYSATCFELVNYIDKSVDSCLGKLHPSATAVRDRAEILETIGFRNFPKNLTFLSQPTKAYGFIDSPSTGENSITVNQDGSVNFKGWAILRNSRELPKTVFFSYGSKKTFFASAVVNLASPDVAKALKSSRYHHVRWATDILPKFLPLGETEIKAWVYDPANKRLIKLNGEPKIKVVE